MKPRETDPLMWGIGIIVLVLMAYAFSFLLAPVCHCGHLDSHITEGTIIGGLLLVAVYFLRRPKP